MFEVDGETDLFQFHRAVERFTASRDKIYHVLFQRWVQHLQDNGIAIVGDPKGTTEFQLENTVPYTTPNELRKTVKLAKCDPNDLYFDQETQIALLPVYESKIADSKGVASARSRSSYQTGRDLLSERARVVSSYGKPEESRLASDGAYRDQKVREFNEICQIAQEACQQSGQPQAAAQIATLQLGGLLLMQSWDKVRPTVAGQPLALLKLALTMSLSWDVPVGAIRHFALGECVGDYATSEKTVALVCNACASVQQVLRELGLN
jgi:hypothetical protein